MTPKPMPNPFAEALMKALASEKANPEALDAALYERSRANAGSAPAKPSPAAPAK